MVTTVTMMARALAVSVADANARPGTTQRMAAPHQRKWHLREGEEREPSDHGGYPAILQGNHRATSRGPVPRKVSQCWSGRPSPVRRHADISKHIPQQLLWYVLRFPACFSLCSLPTSCLANCREAAFLTTSMLLQEALRIPGHRLRCLLVGHMAPGQSRTSCRVGRHQSPRLA